MFVTTKFHCNRCSFIEMFFFPLFTEKISFPDFVHCRHLLKEKITNIPIASVQLSKRSPIGPRHTSDFDHLMSISPTFYKRLCAYILAPIKCLTFTASTKKLRAKLSYEKAARNMLVKLTPCIRYLGKNATTII